MNKKNIIIVSIIVIVLVIGISFANWSDTLLQANFNNATVSCFNLSLDENNPINLQSAFPIRDREGRTLTPYEFTITNVCSTNAYYDVNLEILNNSDLGEQFIKVMVDEDDPRLLSSKESTTPTLSNARNAYRLKSDYIEAGESKTYHLRLWLNENVTLSDNVTEKEFSSKITVRASYMPDPPNESETCEAKYGEGAAVCGIIAQAEPNNSKCLTTDENGALEGYFDLMSDADDPIICSMEDDYGTSYYLRGLHTNNNVKFANQCWKIIRTTGNGGIKMIYNGDVDGSGTCTTTEGTRNGTIGSQVNLTGSKKYSSFYSDENGTYTLTDPVNMTWPDDKNSIIGKYTCNSTSDTCSTLYYVLEDYTDTKAYALKMDQSVNYASISRSAFKNFTNSEVHSSPAYIGYMYGDEYNYTTSYVSETAAEIMSATKANTSNYYYGDQLSYNSTDGNYYITNQDGSDVVQLSWASNYENNLVGKYTCKGTAKYDNKTIRCGVAYKVIDTTTSTNYMIAEILSDGKMQIGDIKISSSYTLNGDTYELTNPITISPMDWHDNYSSYKNYFYCENYNNTSCSNLYRIASGSLYGFGTVINVSNKRYFGSSFTYNANSSRPYTLTNTVYFSDIVDANNKESLNTHHYTCFYGTDNTCDELYYIFYLNGVTMYTIKLNGNEGIDAALEKMFMGDGATKKTSSTIKNVMDYWYKNNIEGTIYQNSVDDTVFCDDRTIKRPAGYSEDGALADNFSFNVGSFNMRLKCPLKRDAFTVSDTSHGNASLTYPIGLFSLTELYLVGNNTAIATGARYWTFAPSSLSYQSPSHRSVYTSGALSTSTSNSNASAVEIRPAIALKAGTKFVEGGDGTASNPYEVEIS